ncbi:MAG: hypothetical protein ACI915_005575, partial [Gammaproteobacteria bacterium]
MSQAEIDQVLVPTRSVLNRDANEFLVGKMSGAPEPI